MITRPFHFAALLLLLPSLAQAAEQAALPAPARAAATASPGREEGRDLTTFLIDRFSEEQRGTGWEERKRMLIEYGAFVKPEHEAPLRDFRGGDDKASRAVEQGKAALVFHMLKNVAGDEQFGAAQKEFINLAKFRRVTWDDVKTVLEKQSGRNLGWFFKQWVDEKGLPDVRVENAAARRSGSRFEVSFDIVQKGKAYALDLPVAVFFARGGAKKEMVKIDGEKKSVKVLVEGEPSKLVVDENYDLARRLSTPETPPTVAALIGGEKLLVVPPVSSRERYRSIIEMLKQRGAKEKEAAGPSTADMLSSSLAVLGDDNPAIGRLYGAVSVPGAGFSVLVKRNPWNPEKVVGIIHAGSAEEAEKAFPDILRSGEYSSVIFDRGTIASRKIGDSRRGMQMELREETTAVDISALKTLTDVIEAAAGKKIIYVGEYHDRFSHHNVEFEVIKSLYQRRLKIAVGMEMFQRPFQPALDDYIAGTIGEREFLKRSEYFQRWGFDYNLYKPILDFCRAEKIPVVALNMRREITEKVSRSGIDSLTGDEKKELPEQMDFSDDEYRKRLKDVFEEHKSSPEREFDFFYQAQVLWDETMAQSIDEFLRKHPDERMVVIAGGGHLSRGSGIPKRAFRRNGQGYAVIMNDAEIERGIADYVVFPPFLDGVTAPKLMAVLKEADGRVAIAGFSQESAAEKAGLKAGDVILALDGEPVKDVGDIKLALYFKKSGDALKVKVIRKRFLFGDKEAEFEVTL